MKSWWLLAAILHPSFGVRCHFDVTGDSQKGITECGSSVAQDSGECCLRMPGVKMCGFASESVARASLMKTMRSRAPTQAEVGAFTCQSGPKCTWLMSDKGQAFKTCTCTTDKCNEQPCPDDCGPKPSAPDAGISCAVEYDGGFSEKTAPCAYLAGQGFGQCCLRGGMLPMGKKSCGFASTSAALLAPLSPAEARAHTCAGGPKCTWTPDGYGGWDKTCICNTDKCNEQPCPEDCGPKPAPITPGTPLLGTGIRCVTRLKDGSEQTESCSLLGRMSRNDFGQCCLRGGMLNYKKMCGFASASAVQIFHSAPGLTDTEAGAHTCAGGPKCTWTPDGYGGWDKTCICNTDSCNDGPCPVDCGPKPGAAQELKAGSGLLLLLLALLRLD